MARDAITRQYDVDKNLVTLTCEPGKGGYRPGVITFYAKKGKSIDLDKLQESLIATRLSGGTSMSVDYLEITVRGTVVAVPEKGLVLKVSERDGEFVLQDDAGAKGMTQKIAETISSKGESVVSVTGRVPGWNGRFPAVLKGLAAAPKGRALLVTGFETAK